MTPESEVVLGTQRLAVGTRWTRDVQEVFTGSALAALATAIGSVLVLVAVVAMVLLAPLVAIGAIVVAARSDRRAAAE